MTFTSETKSLRMERRWPPLVTEQGNGGPTAPAAPTSLSHSQTGSPGLAHLGPQRNPRLLSGESKRGGPRGARRVGEPTWARTGAERPSGPKLQGCRLHEHKVQGARGGQPSGNTGRSSELTGPPPRAQTTLLLKGPAHLRGPRGGGSSWQPQPGPRSPDLQPDLQRGG